MKIQGNREQGLGLAGNKQRAAEIAGLKHAESMQRHEEYGWDCERGAISGEYEMRIHAYPEVQGNFGSGKSGY